MAENPHTLYPSREAVCRPRVSGACGPSTLGLQTASLDGYRVPDLLPRQYCLYTVLVNKRLRRICQSSVMCSRAVLPFTPAARLPFQERSPQYCTDVAVTTDVVVTTDVAVAMDRFGSYNVSISCVIFMMR